MNESAVKGFIVSDDEYEKGKATEHAKRFSLYCKVGKSGRVFFEAIGMRTKTRKIWLTAAARYIANQFDSGISREIRLDEFSTITGIKPDVISARLAELGKRGFVTRTQRGAYVAQPVFFDTLLHMLDRLYGAKLNRS